MLSNNKKMKLLKNSIVVAGTVAGFFFTSTALTAQLHFSGTIKKPSASMLHPPSSVIHTFSDEAGIRLASNNPGDEAITLSLTVTDSASNPIEAVVNPNPVYLRPRDSAEFLVIVPLNGKLRMKFHVCTKYPNSSNFRPCGRYLAKRIT